MNRKWINRLVFAFFLFAAFVASSLTTDAQQRRTAPPQRGDARQRLAPPDLVTCERNDLTVYSGRITSYRRTPASIKLTIATDWETTERVAVRRMGGRSPQDFFLIEGRNFTAADWQRIERRPGVLRAGVRANVWVCADNRNPVVDWQSAAEPPPPARD